MKLPAPSQSQRIGKLAEIDYGHIGSNPRCIKCLDDKQRSIICEILFDDIVLSANGAFFALVTADSSFLTNGRGSGAYCVEPDENSPERPHIYPSGGPIEMGIWSLQMSSTMMSLSMGPMFREEARRWESREGRESCGGRGWESHSECGEGLRNKLARREDDHGAQLPHIHPRVQVQLPPFCAGRKPGSGKGESVMDPFIHPFNNIH